MPFPSAHKHHKKIYFPLHANIIRKFIEVCLVSASNTVYLSRFNKCSHTTHVFCLDSIFCNVQHRPMKEPLSLETEMQRRWLSRQWKSFALPFFRYFTIPSSPPDPSSSVAVAELHGRREWCVLVDVAYLLIARRIWKIAFAKFARLESLWTVLWCCVLPSSLHWTVAVMVML